MHVIASANAIGQKYDASNYVVNFQKVYDLRSFRYFYSNKILTL